MQKYIDKQRNVETIRYSNGVKKIFEGEAIHLPKRLYEGYRIFGDIINFKSKNNNTFSNIASTASRAADSVGKIGSTTIDTIKK